jgi:hypothetical protein
VLTLLANGFLISVLIVQDPTKRSNQNTKFTRDRSDVNYSDLCFIKSFNKIIAIVLGLRKLHFESRQGNRIQFRIGSPMARDAFVGADTLVCPYKTPLTLLAILMRKLYP